MPPALFALVIFHIGFHAFCLGLALEHDPPTYTSQVAGVTNMCQQIQLVLRDMVLLTFLPRQVLNHNPPISVSQVSGITGMKPQCCACEY
jgi:hypothetical protein